MESGAKRICGMMSSKKKIVAIIQARVSSTRLLGKVLMPLCGKTILHHVVDRVKACKNIDQVVVATTDLPVDDKIIEECKNIECSSFRGSSSDVLSRYYYAANEFGADIVIRITSDCPLFDPDILSEMIECFYKIQPDYLSNTIKRTFPRGMDAEIFTFEALEKSHKLAKEDFEKEHVTPYIYQNPDLFKIEQFVRDKDNSKHRWTLDTKDDWVLIEKVYNHLYNDKTLFSYNDVLHLLNEHPELEKINAHIEQKKLGS